MAISSAKRICAQRRDELNLGEYSVISLGEMLKTVINMMLGVVVQYKTDLTDVQEIYAWKFFMCVLKYINL